MVNRKGTLFFDIESHSADFMWDMDPDKFFRLGQYAWDNGDVVLTESRQELIDQIEQADRVVAHNGLGFDLTAIYGKDSTRPLELALDGRVIDTIVLANLVAPAPEWYTDRKGTKQFDARKPERSMRWLSLDNLCFQYGVGGKMGDLKEMAKDANKEAGFKPGDPRGFGLIPMEGEFLEYARQDIVSLRDLYHVLVHLWGLSDVPDDYVWREMKIVAIDAQNSRNGVLIDQDAARARVAELAEERDRIMEILVRDYDFPTTGKSPWASADGKAAIIRILASYGITEETHPEWPRTPTGALKLGGSDIIDLTKGTEAEDVGRAIATLKGQRSLAQLTLDSTHADGRAHMSITRFQRSGRTSVSKPGITVWTARGPGAVEKRYFIPDPGHKFVALDLSNADARIVAAYSGDVEYAKRFEEGVDSHELTGRLVFGDELYDSDPKHYRQTAKACIAAGSLVDTDHGPIPIENVTTDMKVWDGVEYVEHEGIVHKGVREVIEYDGVVATEDHIIVAEAGDGTRLEVPLGVAAGLQLRVATTEPGRLGERVVSGGKPNGASPDLREQSETGRVHGGSMPNMRDDRVVELDERQIGEGSRLSKVQTCEELAVPEVAGSSFDRGKAAVREPEEPPVPQLRGSGLDVRVAGRAIGSCVDGRERAELEPGIADRPDRQQQGLRTWEHSDGHQPGERPEQTEHVVSNGIPPIGVAVCERRGSSSSEGGHDTGRSDRGRSPGSSGAGVALATRRGKAEVYDIVNTGPNHVFSVSGKLVHNCVHAYSYRAGARTLARTAGVDMDTAQRFVKAMDSAYPDVKAWQEDVTEEARRGRVQNDWGRVMAVDKDRAFTQGPALMGQSGTREIICDALIRIAEDNPYVLTWLTFQIHDELIWNIPEDDLWWAVDYIQEMMETTFKPHHGGQEIEFPTGVGEPADNWYGATH